MPFYEMTLGGFLSSCPDDIFTSQTINYYYDRGSDFANDILLNQAEGQAFSIDSIEKVCP